MVAASGSPFHQNRQDLVLQALRVLPGEQGGVGGEDLAFTSRLLLCTRCTDEGLLETCTFVRLSVRQSLRQPDGVLRQRYGDARWKLTRQTIWPHVGHLSVSSQRRRQEFASQFRAA